MKRYGPAEVAGTFTAALGIASATMMFDSPLWIALIGTLAENVGFYSVIFYTELRSASNTLAVQGKKPSWRTRLHVVGSTCLTFGLAESVDSLVSRPALLGLGGVVGELLGRIAGGTGQTAMGVAAFLCKFAADVVYYAMVEMHGAALRKLSRSKNAS